MGKTRKHGTRGKTHVLSIPQLRKSFDYLENWVASHITTAKIAKLVPEFQKEWKKLFHRDIEAPIAKTYLEIKAQFQGPNRRHQKGGNMLVGAPLDYTTQPGVQGVYGNYPDYVASGFTIRPEESVTAMCGKENTTAVVPATLGSNFVGGKRRKMTRKCERRRQTGGSLTDIMSSIAERPISNLSPPTSGSIVEMGTKGVDTSVTVPSQITYTPAAYDPVAIKTAPALLNPNLQLQVKLQ